MLFLTVVAFVAAATATSATADEFRHCATCVEAMATLLPAVARTRSGSVSLADIETACRSEHSAEACAWVRSYPRLETTASFYQGGNSPQSVCSAAGACELEVPPSAYPKAPVSPLDLRITRGFGPDGYNKVRVSVISDTADPAVSSSIFQYSEPFRYRWTNKRLQSGLVTVTPGTPKTLSVGGVQFNVTVPVQDKGSHGIIFADPCYNSKWVPCSFGKELGIFERLPALINAACSHPLDYWMVLGDNFYDRTGEITQPFFDKLTLQTKSTVFATTPGNHDYWVAGTPEVAATEDQYSNGLLQFYPQDTLASHLNRNKSFIDFAVDPDNGTSLDARLPAIENTVWYNMIGNVAFIGFSGAYQYQDAKPLLTDACAWVDKAKPTVAVFVGHWNSASSGCSDEMDVPAVYREMKSMPGCAAMGDRLKYVMGHTHCNEVTQTVDSLATGFMVAGQGMIGCGNFGIPYVSTKNNRLLVSYFSVGTITTPLKLQKNFETLRDCFSTAGIANCQHLATVWLNQTLPSLP